MAAPLTAPPPPVYSKGHGPNRAMELLDDLALEVSPAIGASGAMDLLRQKAQSLGADAVVDVVIEKVKTATPVGQYTAVPNLLMGALMSLVTWNPDALLKVTHQEIDTQLTRTVLLVRGVPVKFLK